MLQLDCVIPTHGRDVLLPRAIESVLHQSTRPHLTVVVDDLGRDSTRRIVEAYMSENVLYVDSSDTSTSSAGASRNRGAEVTSSPYLAFLDDDDFWERDFVTRTFTAACTDNSDMAVAWTQFWQDGRVSAGLRMPPGVSPVRAAGRNPGLTGSNFVISRQAFNQIRGFDETLRVANDQDFLIRFLSAGFRYSIIAEPLVNQVVHNQGQLTTPTPDRAEALEVYARKHERLLDRKGRRQLRREIHAIRRVTSGAAAKKMAHAGGQAWNSDLPAALESGRRLFANRRSPYVRQAGQMMAGQPVVLNIGVVGDRPGGMAQVVNRMTEWGDKRVTVKAAASTRGMRDPLSPLLTIRCVFVLICLLRRRSETVIAVHLSERGSFVREGFLLALASRLGFATAAHLHGAQFVPFSHDRPDLARLVLNHADVIAVLSDRTFQRTVELVDRSKNVRKVVNGVPMPRRVTAPTDERTLLFAGEFSSRKGSDWLLEAWAEVHQLFPEWTLSIAGKVSHEGPATGDLPGIEFLGVLSHECLQTRIAACTVAVLPSRDEALPMFLLEAMSHGKPVVATDVGEIGSICLPDTGWLVDAENPLPKVLTKVMSTDASELAVKGESARALIQEKYSADQAMEQIIPLWLGALRTKD